MLARHSSIPIEPHSPVPTWFGVGGGADRLARPRDNESLAACLDLEPHPLVLGGGANLLVDDRGVDRLVLALTEPHFRRTSIDARRGVVIAGAGADLPRLILDCVRQGLAGLESLAGVPGTVGGAIRMNAGGRFGEIASFVRRVEVADAVGVRWIDRDAIAFAYRESGLEHAVVTRAELSLTPDDPAGIRARLLDIMRQKKSSQPMGERCAGCCYKNPVLERDIDGVAPAGTRVSAGLLIDRAGCKGLRVRSARVSDVHANFIAADAGGTARDVIQLMRQVERRVHDALGVALTREVVVWERSS